MDSAARLLTTFCVAVNQAGTVNTATLISTNVCDFLVNMTVTAPIHLARITVAATDII